MAKGPRLVISVTAHERTRVRREAEEVGLTITEYTKRALEHYATYLESQRRWEREQSGGMSIGSSQWGWKQ